MKTVIFLDTYLPLACKGYSTRVGREEIGALLVGACCQEIGWEVRYLRPNTDQVKNIAKMVNQGGCDALVLFPYTYTKWLADEIARLFKGQTSIIYASYHIGADEQNAQTILAEALADYVILGRGDNALPQLLRSLENGKAAKGVWSQGQTTCPSKYPLDGLPWPMREAGLMQDLRIDPITMHPPRTLDPNPKKLVVIVGSIGCNGRCDFCISHRISPVAIHRSPQNIVKEMVWLQKTYGPGLVFFFSNPLFNADRKWVMELCSLMAKKGPFPSIVMTDFRLDREMVRVMKEAGVYLNLMGLEFVSDRLRVKRGKRTGNPATAYELCSEVGMLTRAFYMLGRRGMTRRSLQEEIEAMMSLPFYPDELRINFEVPFPGTKIAGILAQNDTALEQSRWTTEEPVYRTELTTKEWQIIRQKVIKDFHFGEKQKEHYERQTTKFPELAAVYEAFLEKIEKAYN